jgi:ferritin-like metal-binding protein YciE
MAGYRIENYGESTMSQTAKDIYVVGLRNAHAMEIQARELMERQSERTGDYPEIKAMLTRHLDETREQISRIERCLADCGEDTSALKDTAQSLVANVTALFHSAADDEILKNTFANNAFENFEIAAYKSLIVMSQAAGRQADKGALQRSLDEEQRMADWVRDNVEKVTAAYLQMAADGGAVGTQSTQASQLT